MNKIKLLFINGHLNVGGVERSLVDLLRHLDYSRYEVDLMLLEGAGDYLKEVPKEVNVYPYDFRSVDGPFLKTMIRELVHFRWREVGYRLAKLTKWDFLFKLVLVPCRKRYDVAVSYRTGICNHLAIDVCNAKKRVSWWHHGVMNLSKGQVEMLRREYLKTDVIVSVSEPCSQMLKNEFPESAEKIVTIPNMLNVEDIQQKSGLYEPSLSEDYNIVTVGRLSLEKNMTFCLKVADALRTKEIQFHWYIIGDGAEKLKLEEMIRQLDLAGDVSMLGSLSNPYPYMRKADLYFHPSLVESQGLTILEAMSLETPVVVMNSAGPDGFIDNYRNGIIFGNSVEEASESIIYMLQNNDTDIVRSMIKTVQLFEPEKIMSKLETILIN